MKLIQFDDINEIFGYFIVRVYDSREVEEYLIFLKGWVEQGKYPENITFPNFQYLAKKIQKVDVSPNTAN